MLYNALITALECKETTAKVTSIILAVIPVLLILSTLMCSQISTSVTNKYKSDANDYLKNLQNNDEISGKTQEKLKMMIDELRKKTNTEQ